jgi:ribosomal protein S6
MAERLRDVCKVREDETLWRVGRGFVVRDLPWSIEKLRQLPPFEFENWAVIAFDFSSDALTEIDAYFRKSHKVIIFLTVQSILDGDLAQKLA